jgi:LysM repeat protein
MKKIIAATSLMIVIGAGFSAVGNASEPSNVNKDSHQGLVQIVVAPGETLWSVAGLVGGSDRNSVQSLVDQIVTANHLSNSDVHAGQKLWVPAK